MSKPNSTSTFALGAFSGIVGGFVLGIIFGKYAVSALTVIYHMVQSGNQSDDDRMNFELMLQ